MIHKNKRMARRRGFTLLEILIVIGMIAVLAAVVLVAINPLRQFALARNSQRMSNVNEIMNAISSRTVDNKGIFEDNISDPCKPLPLSDEFISKDGFDIRECLVPDYIPELPSDPAHGFNTCSAAGCTNDQNYDTGYTVRQDEVSRRVTVCSPGSSETAIRGSTMYCVTR